MKILVEPVIDPSTTAMCAWGASPAGLPLLVLGDGRIRILCEMTAEEAKECSACGMFVAMAALQDRNARAGNPGGAAAGLVDGSGMPLRAALGGAG